MVLYSLLPEPSLPPLPGISSQPPPRDGPREVCLRASKQISLRKTRAAGPDELERGRLCVACPSLKNCMLTTAPLWRLVVAHAIWGPTVVDKQNSQNAKQSWVYDWLSQRPAAWSEEVGVDLASCWVPVRPVEELKTPHFLSSGGHHRYSVNWTCSCPFHLVVCGWVFRPRRGTMEACGNSAGGAVYGTLDHPGVRLM